MLGSLQLGQISALVMHEQGRHDVVDISNKSYPANAPYWWTFSSLQQAAHLHCLGFEMVVSCIYEYLELTSGLSTIILCDSQSSQNMTPLEPLTRLISAMFIIRSRKLPARAALRELPTCKYAGYQGSIKGVSLQLRSCNDDQFNYSLRSNMQRDTTEHEETKSRFRPTSSHGLCSLV
jgi:hypothetical protein